MASLCIVISALLRRGKADIFVQYRVDSGFRKMETLMLARMSSLWRSACVSPFLQRADLEDRNISFAGGAGSKGVTQIN